MTEPCPLCGNDMQGEPIPAKYRIHEDTCPKLTGSELCFCLPYGEKTHFSKRMGHQVSGFYDGVAFWSDPSGCGRAWPRRFGVPARDAGAERYAAEFNASAIGEAS